MKINKINGEGQRGTAQLRSLTLVQRVPFQFTVEPKNMFPSLLAPLLQLTRGAVAVDDKDLAVSSDQGNA